MPLMLEIGTPSNGWVNGWGNGRAGGQLEQRAEKEGLAESARVSRNLGHDGRRRT